MSAAQAMHDERLDLRPHRGRDMSRGLGHRVKVSYGARACLRNGAGVTSSGYVQLSDLLARAIEHKVERTCFRGHEGRYHRNAWDQRDSLLIALEHDRLAPIADDRKHDLVAIANLQMRRRHLGATDRDCKCRRGGSDSVVLARDGETKRSRTHEEDDNQNEADKSTAPRQRCRVKQRRQAVKSSHFPRLKWFLAPLTVY